MSEQIEQSATQPASLEAGSAAAPEAVSIVSPEESRAPAIARDHEAPKPDAPVLETVKAEAPPQPAARPPVDPSPGKLMIMAPKPENREDVSASRQTREPKADSAGTRRTAALAAMLALGLLGGAAGGALATGGFAHILSPAEPKLETASSIDATAAQVAELNADIGNLKVSVDHTSKMGMSQFNKTSERLDRLERAQAETLAKLAKLTDSLEKLHAPPALAAAAPAPAAQAPAKEITGSVTPAVTAQPASAPAAEAVPQPTPAKAEVARLPTVDGWVLRDARRDAALIESRRGLYEVFAGDMIPGVGRVDAIRRQDGRWVVVTSRGLIVAR